MVLGSPGLSVCLCLCIIRVAYMCNQTVGRYQHTLVDYCGTAEFILLKKIERILIYKIKSFPKLFLKV